VAAVAIATVLSQFASASLALTRLMRKKDGFCSFSLKKAVFKLQSLGEILRYGIPLAVSTAIYPIANLQIQPAINSFGAANLAGVTAANSIDSLGGALQGAFSSTCVTFMAQNIGAHNKKRTLQAFGLCGLCSVLSGLILGNLCGRVFSEELLGLYLPDNPEAIAWGQRKLLYTTANNWLSAIMGWISASLQALGYPAFTTVNNLVCVLGFRIIWMNFIYPLNPVVDMLYICYLTSWSLTTVFGCVVLSVAFKKYKQKERQYQLEHPIK
jgi:Na+-driven multidrug efflux pump